MPLRLLKRFHHCLLMKWDAFYGPLRFLFTLRLACFLSALRNKTPIDSIPKEKRKESFEGLPGVNLIGAVHAELGLGEYARLSAGTLAATDVPFGVIDYSKHFLQRKKAPFQRDVLLSSPKHKINLFHTNANSLVDVFFAQGKEFFSRHYNIICPFWELGGFPREWTPALSLVDEVWAPSEFIQKALSVALKTPVLYMPSGITLPAFPVLGRSYFNIPDDPYVFLFAFDFYSYIDRKNPEAVIRAFRKAFPKGSERVMLVVKTMNADTKDAKWRRLCERVGEDPRIRVIHETYDKGTLLALKAVCDSFVSLHRSEGLGLGMLEAMLLEKPVICTNYSGNTDFVRADHACLVPYKLIPVEKGQYPFYKGQVWADPDVDHAAGFMEKLYRDRDLGRALGKKAAQFVRDRYDPVRCGERYKQRFLELGLI